MPWFPRSHFGFVGADVHGGPKNPLYPGFALDREEVREKTLILHGEDQNGENQQISLAKEDLLAALETHGAEDF